MILFSKCIEIQGSGSVKVRRICIYQRLVITRKLFDNCQTISIYQPDTLRVNAYKANALHEGRFVKTCIYFIASHLFLASDHASVQGTRSVGTIQIERGESKFKIVISSGR